MVCPGVMDPHRPETPCAGGIWQGERQCHMRAQAEERAGTPEGARHRFLRSAASAALAASAFAAG